MLKAWILGCWEVCDLQEVMSCGRVLEYLSHRTLEEDHSIDLFLLLLSPWLVISAYFLLHVFLICLIGIQCLTINLGLETGTIRENELLFLTS